MNSERRSRLATLLALAVVGAPKAWADGPGGKDADLVKDLQNPVADLISFPMESRFDFGGNRLQRYNLTLQPVIPFEVTQELLVVSRTVVPLVYDRGPISGLGTTTGIGDTLQSFFFAPKNMASGWIYGAGPVLRLPTATKNLLGENAWGAGPTAVVMYQGESWCYALLANHVWSFAGRNGAKINATYLQPTVAYTTPSLSTFSLSSEASHDQVTGDWVIPIDLTYSRIFRIANAPVNIAAGVRRYLERPAGGPTWGGTLTVTLVFPK